MIKFEKVSFEQFLKDFPKEYNYSEEEIKRIYDQIKLPKRATKHSAGYDFFAPFDLKFKFNETLYVPSGIRCQSDEDKVLLLFPRSGLGSKNRMALNNTVGVIDSDYYYANNEGHILGKFHFNEPGKEELTIAQGVAFMQGIFLQYFTTVDDNTEEVRTGGFGSTTKIKF